MVKRLNKSKGRQNGILNARQIDFHQDDVISANIISD